MSAFNLDFVGLTVESIEVDGADAGWTRDEHELTVAPTSGIRNKAAFTVEIAYNGVPESLPELGESGFLHTDDGAVIVGEPSEMRPVLRHKGKVAGRLTVRGRAGHSSRPDLADNAVHLAADIVGLVRRLHEDFSRQGPFHPLFEPAASTLQVGIIAGGTGVNVVPETCRVEWEARAVPGVDPMTIHDTLQAGIDGLVAPLRAAGRAVSVESEILSLYPALDLPDEAPLRGLAEAWSGRPALGAVLAAIGELGGGYSEAVEFLRRADAAKALQVAVAVDGAPRGISLPQLAVMARSDPGLETANLEVTRASRGDIQQASFDLPTEADAVTRAPARTSMPLRSSSWCAARRSAGANGGRTSSIPSTRTMRMARPARAGYSAGRTSFTSSAAGSRFALPVITASPPTVRTRCSACPKFRSVCCRAAVQRNGCRG